MLSSNAVGGDFRSLLPQNHMNMRIQVHCSCLGIAVLLLGGCSNATVQPANLRYKLKAPQELRLTFEQHMNSGPQNSVTRIDGKCRVISVDENQRATIDVVVDNVHWEHQERGIKNEYDYRAKVRAERPLEYLTDLFNSIVSQHTIEVAPEGAIEKVEFSKEFLVQVDNDATRIKYPDTIETYKGLIKLSIPILPAKEVTTGATWTSSMEYPYSIGRIKISKKYRYVGPERVGDEVLDKIVIQGSGNVTGKMIEGGKSYDIEGTIFINGSAFFSSRVGSFIRVDEIRRSVVKFSLEQTTSERQTELKISIVLKPL